jgi:chorismate mutase
MNTLEIEDASDVPTAIAAGRAAIDELDAQILRLVAERQAASRRVQVLRRQAGTPGIQYARENQVISRYTAELGSDGVRLALLLLELCRGSAVAAPREG